VYEITAPIGEGGMGQVYRATDTTLSRQVAIKILPDAFAANPERMARFEREAKTLASLNHPNIAAIYAVEKSAGIHALVMELVEGEDLSQRIARGAIPLDEALPIAKQIAEALEAAHEQSIIHRDLKPANIKVRPDGTVKVLDFGLAKAMEPAGAMSPSMSMSPTITSPAMMTGVGMILGTAAYMSPEQARGKTVDKRTDIWAFGAVLFEMLTGQRAFPGEDVTDTLAAVVRAEPAWSLVPTRISPTLLVFLRRCLHKDPKQRIGDIHDVRLALDGAFETAAPQTTMTPPAVDATRTRVWMAACAAVAVLAAALAVPALWYFLESRSGGAPQTRVDIVTPPMSNPRAFALSPDGRQIALAVVSGGQTMLQVRSLVDGTTQLFANTEGARTPFWSPDARSIGFLANGSLKRLDLSDTSVRTLSAGNGGGQGGSWNADGTIVFARSAVGPILRVSAVSSAESAAVTTVDKTQSGHVFPWLLPDGRTFLYQARGVGIASQVSGLFVGRLDGSLSKRLSDADAFPAVFAADHLIFTRQGRLVAQPFDATTLTLKGEPFRVDAPTGTTDLTNGAGFAVSASVTGSLAFRRVLPPTKALTWFDRSGKEVTRIPEQGDFASPVLSPDGQRLLVRRIVDGAIDSWVLDLARSVWTPTLTLSSQPVWSPDGRRMAFYRGRQNRSAFIVKSVGGAAGEEDVVLDTPGLKSLHGWSPDGRFLIYQGTSPTGGTGMDVWAVPLAGPRTPVALAQTRFDEKLPTLSSDGTWLAYESDESGRSEIYAQPFPGPGERVRISTTGGAQAKWRKDGKELFYVSLDERLMAVPIRASADGTRLELGVATPLFLTQILGGAIQTGGLGPQYDVSSDGQRFLVVTLVEDAVSTPITLIQNWQPDAKK
jgi:Tol biopolymer transport system component